MFMGAASVLLLFGAYWIRCIGYISSICEYAGHFLDCRVDGLVGENQSLLAENYKLRVEQGMDADWRSQPRKPGTQAARPASALARETSQRRMQSPGGSLHTRLTSSGASLIAGLADSLSEHDTKQFRERTQQGHSDANRSVSSWGAGTARNGPWRGPSVPSRQ